MSTRVNRGTHTRGRRNRSEPGALAKCPTGIEGFDQITSGGLPKNRIALICGGAGCGKTLFGMHFLIRGILDYNEPGLCMSFEESAEELAANVSSLGFDVDELVAAKKLAIDHVYIDRSLIAEAGEYDLEALFIRLDYAIKSVGAKRVLLDTVESLFAGLSDHGVLRAELRRLFRWLKDRGVTAVVTGEKGEGSLTRHGLEEYISDCVVVLDHQTSGSVFTRRLRIVKYRGSSHGTNEYPFLITEDGISVLPLTSVALDAPGLTERVSTGIGGLDVMLDGEGYYRGSSVLVSGTPGSGKTSVAAAFLRASCERGEPAVAFLFEESPEQYMRNMRSIGIDLAPWVDKGLLLFHASRPTSHGLEMHLLTAEHLVDKHRPRAVVLDPLSSLALAGTNQDTNSMIIRLLDSLKKRNITAVCTCLTNVSGPGLEQTDLNVSSVTDTWILLRDIETGGERNRGIYVLKSRGMKHSNQIREFLLTSGGIELREPYFGPAGLVTGSARVSQESVERATALQREQELEARRLEAERRQRSIEAQIAALQVDLQSAQSQARQIAEQAVARTSGAVASLQAMTASRGAGTDHHNEPARKPNRRKGGTR